MQLPTLVTQNVVGKVRLNEGKLMSTSSQDLIIKWLRLRQGSSDKSIIYCTRSGRSRMTGVQ